MRFHLYKSLWGEFEEAKALYIDPSWPHMAHCVKLYLSDLRVVKIQRGGAPIVQSREMDSSDMHH